MTYFWKFLKTAMAVVGSLMVLGGAGTSDYYLMELGQPEPSGVWTKMLIGLVLIAPAFISGCIQSMKGDEQ